MYLHIRCKCRVRGIVFRNDQKPRGVLVYTVDYSGAHNAADAGKGGAAMCKQCIHKCAVRVSGCGVHHEPRRFVYDDYVAVLEYYVKGNILWLSLCRPRRRQAD